LFLYIDPLKQGLKQIEYSITGLLLSVFIHRSIKTRIETLPIASISNISSSCFYT